MPNIHQIKNDGSKPKNPTISQFVGVNLCTFISNNWHNAAKDNCLTVWSFWNTPPSAAERMVHPWKGVVWKYLPGVSSCLQHHPGSPQIYAFHLADGRNGIGKALGYWCLWMLLVPTLIYLSLPNTRTFSCLFLACCHLTYLCCSGGGLPTLCSSCGSRFKIYTRSQTLFRCHKPLCAMA